MGAVSSNSTQTRRADRPEDLTSLSSAAASISEPPARFPAETTRRGRPAGRASTRGTMTGTAPTAETHRDSSLVSGGTSLHSLLTGRLTTAPFTVNSEDENHMASVRSVGV